MKPTEGPWTMKEVGGSVELRGHDGSRVATIEYTRPAPRNEERALEDIRLMASAPILAEALRVLLIQAEPHASTDNIGAPAMFHACNIAREALGQPALIWNRV